MQYEQIEMWHHNAFYALDAMGLLDNATPALTLNKPEFDELVETTKASGAEHSFEDNDTTLVLPMRRGTIHAYLDNPA